MAMDKLLLIICFTFFVDVSLCSKYSKEANVLRQNDNDLDFQKQDNPFRMKKVNLLWAKGKKLLSGTILAELYADLKIHDKHEAHLKKLLAQDMDQEGAMAAKVVTNYRRIVRQYGLDDNFSQNDVYVTNELPLNEGDDKHVEFQDSKLQTMWIKALQSGFPEDDLKLLREEFMHQQMKIDEFDFVNKELDKIGDTNDNVIARKKQRPLVRIPRPDFEEEEVKKDRRDIKEGYMKLEHLISTISATEPAFKDSRVHKLWALARKTNWTEEQLNGFKEELLHFEHRLSKQSYYKQQLERSAAALEGLTGRDDIPDKHKHWQEKNEHLNQKINKLHTDFKTRLDKALKHSEL